MGLYKPNSKNQVVILQKYLTTTTIAFVEIIFVVIQKLYLFSTGGYACIFNMLMLIASKYRLNYCYNNKDEKQIMTQ